MFHIRSSPNQVSTDTIELLCYLETTEPQVSERSNQVDQLLGFEHLWPLQTYMLKS